MAGVHMGAGAPHPGANPPAGLPRTLPLPLPVEGLRGPSGVLCTEGRPAGSGRSVPPVLERGRMEEGDQQLVFWG